MVVDPADKKGRIKAAAGLEEDMKDLKVVSNVLGMVDTNCYIIYREKGTEEQPAACVIVDPADNASFIAGRCRQMNLKPEAVLLTHGHFDHIMAAADIRRTFHAPVMAGEKESALLANPQWNLTPTCGEEQTLEADRWLRDGETIELLGLKWRVLFTPGHTEGSVCYYVPEEQMLISGDTLFCESIGRTDLPTGNQAKLLDSVIGTLFTLPDETEVFPGHGEDTTIGYEKKHNYIAYYAR